MEFSRSVEVQTQHKQTNNKEEIGCYYTSLPKKIQFSIEELKTKRRLGYKKVEDSDGQSIFIIVYEQTTQLLKPGLPEKIQCEDNLKLCPQNVLENVKRSEAEIRETIDKDCLQYAIKTTQSKKIEDSVSANQEANISNGSNTQTAGESFSQRDQNSALMNDRDFVNETKTRWKAE